MRQLYQATSRSTRLAGSRGFTLIELLVVIAIIAILASLAIPQYLNYQRKARVSSYAEPIARGCMLDMAAWCMENAGTNPPATLRNCSPTNVTVAGGIATLTVVTGTCNSDGTLTNSSVTATLDTGTGYRAVCRYQNQSVRCTVEST